MQTTTLLIISAACALCAVLLAIAAAGGGGVLPAGIASVLGGGGLGGGGGALAPAGKVNLPLDNALSAWRAGGISGRQRMHVEVKDGAPAMRISYPARGHGSAAGVIFYASPRVLPATQAWFSYRVFFQAGFPWRLGGKLPGLKIGTGDASGGVWSGTGASYRVMWREGGIAVAYVYYEVRDPRNFASRAVMRQDPSFDSIAHVTAGGCDLWRAGGRMRFAAGQWNTVKLYCKLNTPGRFDGVCELEVNGARSTYAKMRWRDDRATIGQVFFATWFGGGSSVYDAGSNCTSWLRDFSLITG